MLGLAFAVAGLVSPAPAGGTRSELFRSLRQKDSPPRTRGLDYCGSCDPFLFALAHRACTALRAASLRAARVDFWHRKARFLLLPRRGHRLFLHWGDA